MVDAYSERDWGMRISGSKSFSFLKASAFLALGLLFLVASAPAYADSKECNISGASTGSMTSCTSSYVAATQTSQTAAVNDEADTNCTSSYCGARSEANKAAQAPIDAHGFCRWVDNATTNSIFIPFRSTNEWTKLLNNLPAGISTVHCARPADASNLTVSATPTYAGCSPTMTVSNPSVYGRTGASIWPVPPLTPAFTCHNGATSVQSQLQWSAGDADSVSASTLSWNKNFYYSPDLTLTVTNNATGVLASPLTIDTGNTVQLNWSSSSGYTGQSWSCLGSNGWGATGNNGSITDAPTVNTTYTMTCTDTKGLKSIASVTVYVNGKCGTDGGATLASTPTNLCVAGEIASAATPTAIGWMWSCTPSTNVSSNTIDGNAQTCNATLQTAQCGTATVDSSGALSSGTLCNAGTPSAVSGTTGAYTCTTGSGVPTNVQSCTATVANLCTTTNSATFTNTGADQTWSVPADAVWVKFQVWGGYADWYSQGNGGNGYVEGKFSVGSIIHGGDVLRLMVGSPGAYSNGSVNPSSYGFGGGSVSTWATSGEMAGSGSGLSGVFKPGSNNISVADVTSGSALLVAGGNGGGAYQYSITYAKAVGANQAGSGDQATAQGATFATNDRYHSFGGGGGGFKGGHATAYSSGTIASSGGSNYIDPVATETVNMSGGSGNITTGIFTGGSTPASTAASITNGDSSKIIVTWATAAACPISCTAGSVAFTDPGVYTFTVPTGVTSVDAVAVGGGGGGGNGICNQMWAGGGGGGAGLAYGNSISVTPGQTITVTVGAGGNQGPCYGYGQTGGTTSFGGYLIAYGGTGGGPAAGIGGSFGGSAVSGGGHGGNGTGPAPDGAGGGAGGYNGNGGDGSTGTGGTGTGGAGGGGGGGGYNGTGSGGGGVGIFGIGPNGTGGVAYSRGNGGSYAPTVAYHYRHGGDYGGGGGGGYAFNGGGGKGGVNVSWGNNGSCAPAPAQQSCAATNLTWGSCASSISAIPSGTSTSVTNTTSGYSGSVTASCTNGVITQSGATCTQLAPAGCAATTITWGLGIGTLGTCTSSTPFIPVGGSTTVTDPSIPDPSNWGYANLTCNADGGTPTVGSNRCEPQGSANSGG